MEKLKTKPSKPKRSGGAVKRKKPDLKIEKIHARFKLNSDELAELGLSAGRAQNEIANLEEQLSSIKKDYSGRIETQEGIRNNAFRKMQDGFDMRELEAVIEFDPPNKKKKSFRYDPKKKGGKGELITEEAMTPADFERDLFERKPGSAPGGAGNGLEPFKDELIKSATELFRKENKASVAMLQRTFSLGYTRAARLMDELETRKVVGPAKGSEPREVIPAPLNPVLSEETASKLSAPESAAAAEAANGESKDK